MLKKLFFVCFFVQVLSGNIISQNKYHSAIDSTLLTYYNKCMKMIQSPEVLLMADTLFEMAGNQDDLKMQAVALCTKLDHYYYTLDDNNADSLKVWVNRVRKFARETYQPKYYYFVWSSRLIKHHISLGEYNIALLETEKMLHEAEAEDYKEGIADCYQSMSSIYATKEMKDKTLEFILKEINITEKYDLDRYNISLQYSNAARYSVDIGKEAEARRFLGKALEHVNTLYQEVYAKLSFISYYLAVKDLPAAQNMVEECRRIYSANPSLEKHIHYLYAMEFHYYDEVGQYDRALQISDKWEKALIQRNEPVSVNMVRKQKGDIYWKTGRKEAAANYYHQYLEELETEKIKSEEITTAEFATLLDMQKLTTEKSELITLSQKRKLQNTSIIILSLSGLLFIVFGFLYHQRTLYRKLKRSRDKLNKQNLVLLEAEKELKHARDMAEQSSRMKTAFIQSMSHEIRTPLNSIVGFSAVIADLYSGDNEEILQYASLIESNSRLLLKMITDILSISALDEMDGEIPKYPVDIHKCCIRSIEAVKPQLASGVKVNIIAPQEEIIINTNESFILQVLENLLDNAAKFTPEGEITLAYALSNAGNELTITVKDTGIGIPEDKQEYIFERFVKLDEFTQGTGLGLAICRMIAEKLGGTLIMDKKNMKGSCFVFSIPL